MHEEETKKKMRKNTQKHAAKLATGKHEIKIINELSMKTVFLK